MNRTFIAMRIAISAHTLMAIAWIYSMPVCLLIIAVHWMPNL